MLLRGLRFNLGDDFHASYPIHLSRLNSCISKDRRKASDLCSWNLACRLTMSIRVWWQNCWKLCIDMCRSTSLHCILDGLVILKPALDLGCSEGHDVLPAPLEVSLSTTFRFCEAPWLYIAYKVMNILIAENTPHAIQADSICKITNRKTWKPSKMRNSSVRQTWKRIWGQGSVANRHAKFIIMSPKFSDIFKSWHKSWHTLCFSKLVPFRTTHVDTVDVWVEHTAHVGLIFSHYISFDVPS